MAYQAAPKAGGMLLSEYIVIQFWIFGTYNHRGFPMIHSITDSITNS